MFTKKEDKFKETMRAAFNTPQGIDALIYLKSYILDKSPIAETNELTYYNIGKQDLVRSLVDLLEDKDRFEELDIPEYDPLTN